MDSLNTPWRLKYISDSKPSQGCFLCAAGKEPQNPERLVIHLEDPFMVMLNRYPYTNGHLMVAPREHVGVTDSLGDEANRRFWPLVGKCRRVLETAYSPDGFNLGANLGAAGGAGVPDHFHFHVVPRWNGDTNFMTAVGGVRLVPEELEDVMARLAPIFEELA